MNLLGLNSTHNFAIKQVKNLAGVQKLYELNEVAKIEATKDEGMRLVNLAKSKILESINTTIAGSHIVNAATGDMASSFDRYAYISKNGELISGLYDVPTLYEISNNYSNLSDKNFSRYFEQIGASKFHDSPYNFSTNKEAQYNATMMLSKDTKLRNINEYGLSDTLKTAYGDVKVFFDPYGDDDKMGFGSISANVHLINFDTSGDGVLDSNDENFHKLKVKGYDINGNEKIAFLSDVVRQINLTDFIAKEIINHNLEDVKRQNEKAINILENKIIDPTKFDHRISYNASNPYTIFKPEYRYKQMSEVEIDELFDALAGPDGWVDLRGGGVFNQQSQYLNFAYEKLNLNSEQTLAEFNPIISEKDSQSDTAAYVRYQKDNFMRFYKDYKAEILAHNESIATLIKALQNSTVVEADELIKKLSMTKSARLNAMEREFKENTGMNLSLRNLEKLKRRFEVDTKNSAYALKDTDAVVAMKQESDGKIRLRFDSGRELVVSRIYQDTGKLNDMESSKCKSVFIKKIDTKIANVPEFGSQKLAEELKQSEIKSGISELGLAEFKMGKYDSKFYTMAQNLNANELFAMTSLEHLFNDKFIEFSEIKPEHKFYQHINTYV